MLSPSLSRPNSSIRLASHRKTRDRVFADTITSVVARADGSRDRVVRVFEGTNKSPHYCHITAGKQSHTSRHIKQNLKIQAVALHRWRVEHLDEPSQAQTFTLDLRRRGKWSVREQQASRRNSTSTQQHDLALPVQALHCLETSHTGLWQHLDCAQPLEHLDLAFEDSQPFATPPPPGFALHCRTSIDKPNLTLIIPSSRGLSSSLVHFTDFVEVVAPSL